MHSIQTHAITNARKRIPGEIQVWYGIHHKMVVLLHEPAQAAFLRSRKLLHTDTGHCFLYEHMRIRNTFQVLGQLRSIILCQRSCAGNNSINERIPNRSICSDGFCRQILQEYDLCAVFPQKLHEPVMLLLRAVQIGNVVKEQAFQRIRHKILQLPPRAVKQDLLQRTDLTFNVDGTLHGQPSYFSIF